MRYASRDSIRFETPASLRRCGAARGFVFEGELRGNGVLLWLRGDTSLRGGRYPVLPRGDTLTPRGAVVAVRFMIGDMAHGLTLDSGWVTVATGGGEAEQRGASAAVAGAGLEATAGRRVGVAAEFTNTTPASAGDSARCETRL